jgi:hypothetical protein
MEMVVKYWKEEEGYDCLYDDNAFCAYSYGDGEFFIAHLYVEKRKAGATYSFFNKVKKKAKELGANRITGNLYINEANQDSYSKKVMLHLRHGYKIVSVDSNRITVLKEL